MVLDLANYPLVHNTYMRIPLLGSGTPCHILQSFIMVGFVCLIGCAASQPIEPPPIQKALLGKSKQALIACAGNPSQETKTAEGTVLTYYKEASMLDESFPFSQGSRAGAHRGCWASLLLADDRGTGLEYRKAPSTLNTDDLCEKIFETCVQ